MAKEIKIAAKYDSRCRVCKSKIQIGDDVIYTPGVGVRHPGCIPPTAVEVAAAEAAELQDIRDRSSLINLAKQLHGYAALRSRVCVLSDVLDEGLRMLHEANEPDKDVRINRFLAAAKKLYDDLDNADDMPGVNSQTIARWTKVNAKDYSQPITRAEKNIKTILGIAD